MLFPAVVGKEVESRRGRKFVPKSRGVALRLSPNVPVTSVYILAVPVLLAVDTFEWMGEM